MSSDAAAAARAATELQLGELIAIQPRKLRGALASGQRAPGGARPGKGRAQSLDFDGISPYAPGDDVRWIEWRASLRSGVTQMRRFAAESHRARMIVLDLRPDLYFGAADRLMAKSACLIAAWLAWESLGLQEPVGLSLPNGEEIAPRRGRRHVLGLLDAMTKAYQAVDAGPGAAGRIDAASRAIGRGDEICLVSDLPVEPAPLAAEARRLAHIRRLTLCLVDDRAIAAGPPAGRYPVKGPDGVRLAPALRADQAEEGGAQDAAARRRRTLVEAGWDLRAMLDVLPRGVAAS